MAIKVAAIQMDCSLGDRAANMAKAKSFVEKAADEDVRLLVLPELFSTGYRLDPNYHSFSENIPDGNTTQDLLRWAKKAKLYILGCIIEMGAGGSIHDTAFLVGPEGFLGKYRKINPWRDEKVSFEPGSGFEVWESGCGKIGPMICYDGGFPEISRQLALKGAEILVVPSAFGKERLYAWDIFTRARALENGCFLIAADRVGQEAETVFAGHSRIVGPRGEIMAELSEEEEGLLIAEIDLEQVVVERSTIPYHKDLRRDLFRYG